MIRCSRCNSENLFASMSTAKVFCQNCTNSWSSSADNREVKSTKKLADWEKAMASIKGKWWNDDGKSEGSKGKATK